MCLEELPSVGKGLKDQLEAGDSQCVCQACGRECKTRPTSGVVWFQSPKEQRLDTGRGEVQQEWVLGLGSDSSL